MIFGLTKETVQNITSVFEEFPQIEKVILYGSRAKGNYKRGSDIDLTLMGENLNLTVVNKIEMAIDDLLLPYSFDISIFQQIVNPELKDHIERVGITFYSKATSSQKS